MRAVILLRGSKCRVACKKGLDGDIKKFNWMMKMIETLCQKGDVNDGNKFKPVRRDVVTVYEMKKGDPHDPHRFYSIRIPHEVLVFRYYAKKCTRISNRELTTIIDEAKLIKWGEIVYEP
jgi:hypothetical protein